MNGQLWHLRQIRCGPVASPRLLIDALTIPSGVTALMGPSGAGKSTLLNLLIEFEQPNAGTLERIRCHAAAASATNATSATKMPQSSEQAGRTPRLAWVPADFGLWPHLTVEQHLQLVAPKHADHSEALLTGFELQSVRRSRPETLSTGERARLSVARALSLQADLLIMDEPFAHVDPSRIDRYWQLLREQLQSTQASLVFSSHQPEAVLREADFLVCLDAGRVTWTGTPADLYHAPPTFALGALLGPLNWFSPDDATDWLDHSAAVAKTDATAHTAAHSITESPPTTLPEAVGFGVRPEQLSLTREAATNLQLQRSWQVGPYQQSEIRSQRSGQSKVIVHRPVREIAPGDRVSIRLSLLVLLVLFGCMLTGLSGCRESSGDDPVLKVRPPQHSLLPSDGARLPAARAMTFSPAGELFVLDDVGRVVVYDATGEWSRQWWMPAYQVGRPEGICVLRDGRLAVADTHYHRVVFFDQQGNTLGTFGEFGYDAGQFVYCSAVAQDEAGFLYVSEYGGNDRIQKFTPQGESVLAFGTVGTEPGEFQRPSGIVCQQGTIFVSDAINSRVQAFDAQGKFLRIVADAQTAGLYYPYDIARGADNSLFVIEYGAGRLTRLATDGKVLGRYGREGRGVGHFWTPWGLAINTEGPQQGKIVVADTGNRRLVELRWEE